MEAEFIRKESIFLLLLLIIAVFAGAARRLRVPYPILLTIIGGILGGLPIFPNIAPHPNLVFFVFLASATAVCRRLSTLLAGVSRQTSAEFSGLPSVS